MTILSPLTKIHRDLWQTKIGGTVYDIRRTRAGWRGYSRFDDAPLTAPVKELGHVIFLLKSRLMRSNNDDNRTSQTTDKSLSE